MNFYRKKTKIGAKKLKKFSHNNFRIFKNHNILWYFMGFITISCDFTKGVLLICY